MTHTPAHGLQLVPEFCHKVLYYGKKTFTCRSKGGAGGRWPKTLPIAHTSLVHHLEQLVCGRDVPPCRAQSKPVCTQHATVTSGAAPPPAECMQLTIGLGQPAVSCMYSSNWIVASPSSFLPSQGWCSLGAYCNTQERVFIILSNIFSSFIN